MAGKTSGVRVLVGRGRARSSWVGWKAPEMGRQRPAFRGLGDLPRQGIAGRPEPDVRVAVERLVRAADPAVGRRRQDLGAGGQQVRLRGVPGTHQWYDGTPHPWEFKRVWHLEPSLTDAETVYAGVEDAALFRSTDGGKSGTSCPGCAARLRARWQPGAGGMCLHTMLLDPATPTGSSSRSPRRAHSAPTTAENVAADQPGLQSRAYS